MPRPHEDLARHTLVDHRRGGPPVGFAPDAWCAIEIAHVTPERIDAGVSAYETLVEKARAAASAGAAAVLRSIDRRRVIVLLALGGHADFRRLTSAWEDRRLEAEHLSVTESATRALYRLAGSAGEGAIDPDSRDAYAFERVARAPQVACRLLGPLAAAPGFRGALIFGTDDGISSALVYRFEHFGEIDVFRASAAAFDILGPSGATGDSLAMVHAVKTFDRSA